MSSIKDCFLSTNLSKFDKERYIILWKITSRKKL